MDPIPTKDRTPLAVLVIVITVLLLTIGDAVIKGFSADLRLWQIFVLRSCIALPILILVLRGAYGTVELLPKALGWSALRSVMLTSMWVAYYASLPHLELSVAAAAYYTLPIFITLFSALFVGESVGRVGWFAVVLGFVSVLVILRPASDNFNLYAVLPLLSAILYALSMILTRTKCREEHPLVLSTILNVSFIVVGVSASFILLMFGDAVPSTSFLSPVWIDLTRDSALGIGVMVVAILVGSIGTAIAYQNGRSSVVATFDFSYVGFATIWGIIFFGESPDAWTLIGIAGIVAAGMLAVTRRG